MISETIKCNNKKKLKSVGYLVFFAIHIQLSIVNKFHEKRKINTTIVNISTYEGQKMHK